MAEPGKGRGDFLRLAVRVFVPAEPGRLALGLALVSLHGGHTRADRARGRGEPIPRCHFAAETCRFKRVRESSSLIAQVISNGISHVNQICCGFFSNYLQNVECALTLCTRRKRGSWRKLGPDGPPKHESHLFTYYSPNDVNTLQYGKTL